MNRVGTGVRLQNVGMVLVSRSACVCYLEGVLRPSLNSGAIMASKKIYVEKRPEGDFAVRRADSERASAIEKTQREAIDRARELNPGVAPHVERVRNTSTGSPDKWRKP